MEHEAEYAKLMRRGTDYDELLRQGYIAVRTQDPEAWRAEIKAKARADKIKVRTGAGSSDAWAYLKKLDDQEASYEVMRAAMERIDVVQEAFGRASLRGHLVRRIVRSEGGRAAAACPDCGARLYIDTNVHPPFMEGEVFDQDCPAAVLRD